VPLEELSQLKNAITLSEIEPVTLWLVAYWHEMSIYNLNNWVMHPVARVSIKYWKNLRTQHRIF
jgi:hypothetical protein